MGKIISISNKKGGSGKTTTTVNLSTALSINGKKVLAIDLDPQGHTTFYLNVNNQKLPDSVFNLFTEDDFSIYRVMEKTNHNNLLLVPGSDKLYQITKYKKFKKENFFILKKKLKKAKEDFDYIIIDTPPSLGLLTYNTLVASTDVIIPLQTHFLSLKALKELVIVINKYIKDINPDLKSTRILPTMCDFRENITDKIINEVRTIFKDKVFDTVIRKSVRLAESPQYKQSIIEYKPHSAGAIDYYNLAREIIFSE